MSVSEQKSGKLAVLEAIRREFPELFDSGEEELTEKAVEQLMRTLGFVQLREPTATQAKIARILEGFAAVRAEQSLRRAAEFLRGQQQRWLDEIRLTGNDGMRFAANECVRLAGELERQAKVLASGDLPTVE